ncbi:hypothetical protein ACQEVY_23425 [Streptomyces sp. CA-288835]|uniref:hypothetical protein n=1 Tax=Streptomyces sp. CA-288835 TaxID=3240069 RepID=UPI003D92FC7D
MVDPISVAGSSAAKALTSVLTKRLQSKAGLRLGSRDERRQVYARFQGAVTDSVASHTAVRVEQSLHTVWLGKRASISFRPSAAYSAASAAIAQLRQAESELIQAYLDLRLVANPEPLRAADVIVERIGELQALHPSVKVPEMLATANGVFDSQREFTDVCRDDLWYLPKRWQVYRPAWWSARRWRRHRPQ